MRFHTLIKVTLMQHEASETQLYPLQRIYVELMESLTALMALLN